MSKFSETLKKLRTKNNYTQKQVADLLGVSESTIGMYERGQREPNFETLEAIADIFNVYISDLVEKKPASQQDELTDLQKQAMQMITSLDDKAITALLGFIAALNNQYDE